MVVKNDIFYLIAMFGFLWGEGVIFVVTFVPYEKIWEIGHDNHSQLVKRTRTALMPNVLQRI